MSSELVLGIGLGVMVRVRVVEMFNYITIITWECSLNVCCVLRIKHYTQRTCRLGLGPDFTFRVSRVSRVRAKF